MGLNQKAIQRRGKGGSGGSGKGSAGASAGRTTEWSAEQLARAHRCVDSGLAGIEACIDVARRDHDDAALIRITNFMLSLGLELHGASVGATSGQDRARVLDAFVRKPLTGGDQGGGGLHVDGDEPQDPGQDG